MRRKTINILLLGIMSLIISSCETTIFDSYSHLSTSSEITSSTSSEITSLTSSSTAPTYTYYTVTFDSLGGSDVASVQVMSGNPVVMPQTPVYEGYYLTGWYTSDEIIEDNLWDFSRDRVTSDITLYAGWILSDSQEYTQSLVYTLEDNEYTITGVGDETLIIIPETYNNLPVSIIGESAFARKSIIRVILPDSIREIGLNAFHNCQDLLSIQISQNSKLTTIGNNAFSGNSSLQSFYFPQGLISLGDSVFNNCGSISNFIVHEDNSVYTALNGHLVNKQDNSIIRGSNNNEIPEGIITIKQAAFRRSKITSISIPSSVTTIENYAFSDCESLTRITVSEDNANFSSYNGLLYNKNQSQLLLVPEAISGNVILSSSLLEIPQSSFDGYASISSVFIPTSVTRINNFSFRNTTLTIRYEGSEEQWNNVTKGVVWGGANLQVIFNASQEIDTSSNRVKLSFNSHEIYMTLTDNSATRDLISRLSTSDMTLQFTDYGSSEKIAYPTPALDVSDTTGCDPKVGDVTIYTPWSNIAIFYEDSSSYSNNLVLLGSIEGTGITLLSQQNQPFEVTLSLV